MSQQQEYLEAGPFPWVVNAQGEYYATGSISCPWPAAMLSTYAWCDGDGTSVLWALTLGQAKCHAQSGIGDGIYVYALCAVN